MASVSANSERTEHVGFLASFENASGNNKILNVTNANDETRLNVPDEVSELSVPETHFDRQAHTPHMVTGKTTQTNQIPEFLPGRTLTSLNQPSNQHHNLSTQVSQDNNLRMVERTPENQNLHANNSFNRLADAILGIATQKRPQAAKMLKPVSINRLFSVGKTRNSNSLKTYFTQCSKCN